jgi:hypothetical protein
VEPAQDLILIIVAGVVTVKDAGALSSAGGCAGVELQLFLELLEGQRFGQALGQVFQLDLIDGVAAALSARVPDSG